MRINGFHLGGGGEYSGSWSIICTESGNGSSRIHSPDQEKRKSRGSFISDVSWAASTSCGQRRLYPVTEGSLRTARYKANPSWSELARWQKETQLN